MDTTKKQAEYNYSALGALFHTTASFLAHESAKLHRILSGPAVNKEVDADSFRRLTAEGLYVAGRTKKLNEWVKGIDALEIKELSESEKEHLFNFTGDIVRWINKWEGRYITLRQSSSMFDALDDEDMKDGLRYVHRMSMDLYNSATKIVKTPSV